MERPKAMDPEDERRRRERRHRERERERDGKPRSKRAPGYRLDVIDKLDVTSIFGTGCRFPRSRFSLLFHPMEADARPYSVSPRRSF